MSKICNYMDISKSWYYEMKASAEQRREYEAWLLTEIKRIRAAHPAYGILRLWKQLERDGIKIGRDRLERFLQRHNLLLSRHPKKVRTTFPGAYEGEYENKLKGLSVDHQNQVWCTDITYIHTTEGVLYLSAIMDVYSRKIISISINDNLRTDGSLDCLNQALAGVSDPNGIIHHSDHGCQYCSYRYLEKLSQNGLEVSFTGKDHCYDNAKIERFFKTIKYEYGLKSVIKSKKLAKSLIKNAVYDYNHNRIHSSLNYMTPCDIYDAA